MSIHFGNILKKVLPIAATAAGAYFGMPAIGGLFSANGANTPQAPPGDNGGEPTPTPAQISGEDPTPQRIGITAPPPQQPGADWTKLASAAVPLAVGALNYQGQQQTNVANAQQAKQQMDFQAQQTATAYQRGTADMQAAGLNPMLAYTQGGASSGSGASAQMGNSLGAGANSALSAAQTMTELQQLNEQTKLTAAQRLNTEAKTATELTQPDNIKANTLGQDIRNRVGKATIDAQIREASSAARLKSSQADIAHYQTSEERNKSKLYDIATPYLDQGSNAISSALDGLRSFGSKLGTTTYDILHGHGISGPYHKGN